MCLLATKHLIKLPHEADVCVAVNKVLYNRNPSVNGKIA